MSIVSNNIKYLRRMNGLTQEQFARKIGIKRSLLGAYEEGRANPNLDNLMNIAKIFGTSVDNLLQNDLRRLRESRGVPLPQPSQQLAIKEEAEPPKQLSNLIDKYYRQNNSSSVTTPENTRTENFPEVSRMAPQNSTFNSINHPTTTSSPSHQPTNSNHLLFQSQTENEQKGLNKPSFPTDRLKQEIEWVSQAISPEYLTSYAYPEFLKQLPSFHLPMLPPGKYRAFEMGTDFSYPGSIVVGQFVNSWYDVKDSQHYILVIYKQGILYRRVYNQVKIKGTLLLSSDTPKFPSYEVSIKEVLEVWEPKAFIGLKMPEPSSSVSLDRLKELAKAIQLEVESLEK